MNSLPKGSAQSMSVKQMAELLKCPYKGRGSTVIRGFNSPERAEEGDLVFISHRKHLHFLEKTRASAAIIPRGEKYDRIPVLLSANPHLTFVQAIKFFFEPYLPQREIHPTAQISPSAKIGKNVGLGAFSYIGEEVEIGARTIIFPLVAIYPGVKIGKKTIIHSCVSIREGVRIGNNVIIHSGAVIGSDGFGYLQKKDGSHIKIPQMGTVRIEDDVEIGANTTIDRAALGETVIKKGSRIDNLVQIAHNVEIGENSILTAQVGIAGSSKVGKRVTMGGQAGVSDHVNIGNNAMLAAQSGVMKDIPPNSVVGGTPHVGIRDYMKITASLPRIPELVKTVKNLKARIEELERKLKGE